MASKFRFIVFLMILLECFWFVVSTEWSYFDNYRAMAWSGAGSVVPLFVKLLAFYFFSLSYFLVYLALYFFRLWARSALLAVIVIDVMYTLLSGILVYSAFEAILAKLLMMGAGLVLGLSYCKGVEHAMLNRN